MYDFVMRWVLSDGTVVTHSPKSLDVSGDGATAVMLRAELVAARGVGKIKPSPIWLYVHPIPSGTVEFDESNPRHVDDWVRWRAGRCGATIDSAPTFPAVKVNESDPPGTIY